MKNPPEYRYRAVLASVKKKSRPKKTGVEQHLYDLLTKKDAVFEVTRAYDIYAREFKRETLEALLLVGADASEVEHVLRVPPGVTEAYRTLFFDTDVFEDELDIIDYAKNFDAVTFGGELKHFAVDCGKECLKVRISRGNYVVDSGTVLDGVRSMAYLMTQLAKINRSNSNMANVALRWAQVSLRAVPEEKDDDEAGVEKLRVALETRDGTINEEKSGISKDTILH